MKKRSINSSDNLSLGRNNLIYMTEALLDPVVLVLSIWSIGLHVDGEINTNYLILSMLVFSLTFPGRSRLHFSFWHSIMDITISWLYIAGLILFFGYATSSAGIFPGEAIIQWLWISPCALMVVHTIYRITMPILLTLRGNRRRAVIVGMNEQGMELAQRIASSPYSNIDLLGFFDDRTEDRSTKANGWKINGKMNQLAQFVKEQRVQLIYLSLPMATQPRILSILDDLRDTTASVYFVPDLFVTDLIQGRMDHICNMPVVSVCETPFTGTNGLLKRASDILLSAIILIMISPLLLIIGLAVKLTSSGPIIFKQRRYGLDGEEILVYKFRSMTVCEDGNSIQQAQKNDKRVTTIGAFLRKTSLDELPQFINVLQGRMSIVGPRPHAVAHNEMYRGLIKGYMVRHKVKPGITGWAQVNGLRGETDTLDKMQARIEYDLDYLRHWSLYLDLKIIFLTVAVVFKDQYAY